MSIHTPHSGNTNKGIGLWDRYPVALVIGALLGMAGAPLVQKIAKQYSNSTQAIVATAMPLDDTIGEKIILEMNYEHLPETERLSIQRLMNPGNKEHYKLIDQGTVNNIEYKRWESKGFTYVEYYDHSGKVIAREDVSKGRVTEKNVLDNDKKNTKVKGARLVFFDAENKPFGGYDLYGPKVDPKSYYHTLAHHMKKTGDGAKFSEQMHIFSELGFVYVSDRENGVFKTLYTGDDSRHSADETIQRAQIHDAGEKNGLHGMLFGDCDDFAEVAKRIIRCAQGEEYPVISIHVPRHATCIYREPGTDILCTVCTMGGVYRGGEHFGTKSFDKTGKKTDKMDEVNDVLRRYFGENEDTNNMNITTPQTVHFPLKASGEFYVNILAGKGKSEHELLPWKQFEKDKFGKFYKEKLRPREKKMIQ